MGRYILTGSQNFLLTEFYNNKAASDGKQSRCAECVRAYDKAYRTDPKRREKKNKYLKDRYRRKQMESCTPYRCLVEVDPGDMILRISANLGFEIIHVPQFQGLEQDDYRKLA